MTHATAPTPSVFDDPDRLEDYARARKALERESVLRKVCPDLKFYRRKPTRAELALERRKHPERE